MIYSMVLDDNKIYIAANGCKLGNSTEGIVVYDKMQNKLKKFSDVNIDNLNNNFYHYNNGFITVLDNDVLFLGEDGSKKVLYSVDSDANVEIRDYIFVTDKNNIYISEEKVEPSGAGLISIPYGKVTIDLSTFKVKEEIYND